MLLKLGVFPYPSNRWLVYSDIGFEGMLAVLEPGEFPCPQAWGFDQPFIGSMRALRMVTQRTPLC